MKIVKGFYVSREEKGDSLKALLVISSAGFAFVGLLMFFPLTVHSFYPPCPWYALTHTYCPGCGTLRGLNALLHGDLFGLLRYNLLAMLVAPILIYSFLNVISRAIYKYSLPFIFLTKRELWLLAWFLVLYAILRNLIPILAPAGL